MKQTAPHYLLLCEANSNRVDGRDGPGGNWSFVLERIGSSHRIEVAECEPNVTGERLELLAVVRGLEALEQPSRVTLFTSSRFVGHGIRRHLQSWRENGFRWERFGEMIPINHQDFWIRVDRALHFHDVDCRVWQFETAASLGSSLVAAKTPHRAPDANENSPYSGDRRRRRTRPAPNLANVLAPSSDEPFPAIIPFSFAVS